VTFLVLCRRTFVVPGPFNSLPLDLSNSSTHCLKILASKMNVDRNIRSLQKYADAVFLQCSGFKGANRVLRHLRTPRQYPSLSVKRLQQRH